MRSDTLVNQSAGDKMKGKKKAKKYRRVPRDKRKRRTNTHAIFEFGTVDGKQALRFLRFGDEKDVIQAKRHKRGIIGVMMCERMKLTVEIPVLTDKDIEMFKMNMLATTKKHGPILRSITGLGEEIEWKRSSTL